MPANDSISILDGSTFLLDTVKGADLGSYDGRLVFDFNFATTHRARTTRDGYVRSRRPRTGSPRM